MATMVIIINIIIIVIAHRRWVSGWKSTAAAAAAAAAAQAAKVSVCRFKGWWVVREDVLQEPLRESPGRVGAPPREPGGDG